MRVKADVGALKRTTWKEYAMRFVFGGLVAIIAGAVGHKYGPVVGGLFLAFPAIFPASATLIADHEEKKEQKAGSDGKARGAQASGVDAAGTAMGSIGLMAFGGVIWATAPRLAPFAVLSLALAVWLATCGIIWVIRQKI
jgi:hypothetical protein